MKIAKLSRDISELLLVRIDGKKVYENLDFEEEQVSKGPFQNSNIYHKCSFWDLLPVSNISM